MPWFKSDRPIKFELDGVELENARKWFEQHVCNFYDKGVPKLNEHGFPKGGAIGGVMSFRFTPTGVGTAVVVLCGCGHEENVTDFDSW